VDTKRAGPTVGVATGGGYCPDTAGDGGSRRRAARPAPIDGPLLRFALRRDQVSAIQLGPGGPGWWREPRIYVTWRSEECGAGGTFNLSAASARSARQLGRETRALARQLHAWSEQPSPLAVAPSSLPDLAAPAVGGVTSVSPRTLSNGRVVIWSMLVMAALAAGVSVLMSLPFDPDQGGAA
jgi:hypothetical protein